MWWRKKKGPKRVAFLDGSENGIKNAASLTGPLNGRLTCLYNVSERLSDYGHTVEVVGRHPRFITSRGVTWCNELRGDYDALVSVRGYTAAPEVTAKKRILWVRDLPHSGFCPEPEKLAGVQVVALSHYGARIWKDFYHTIGNVKVIPNGVDKKKFRVMPLYERNPKLFIFASNPNRGLDRLPLIFETLRMQFPDAHLIAFSDRETLHPGETGDYADTYKRCQKAGIDLRPPLPPGGLSHWMRVAGAMVMPTDYPEICSNTVLQALACGCPVITTGRLGATAEWIQNGKNGLLTEYQKHDYQIFDLETTRLMAQVAAGGKPWQDLCRGAAKTPVWSWDNVAREWEGIL